MSSKRPFEVNTRAVFAFMGIGCGLSAITDWSTMMIMPNCLNKLHIRSTNQNSQRIMMAQQIQ